MENTLIRSEPCPECGEPMLWTQNAWPADAHSEAAYRCVAGHVVDPVLTKQCPTCGIHDTVIVGPAAGSPQTHRCYRCGNAFEVGAPPGDRSVRNVIE